MRVLVLFFHPALEKSRVQRRLLDAARAGGDVTVRDLYELYPDFDVDVAAEQAALLEHDLLVFQHPFYWYSGPALLKQWQDLVLEHGWAYGSTGTALRGKLAFHAITAGGGPEAYRPGGLNGHEIATFLLPFQQTTRLCGIRWLPPFCVTGTHRMDGADISAAAASYRRLLADFAAGRVPLEIVAERPTLNHIVDGFMKPKGRKGAI